jgi:nickel transport protein
MNLVKLMAAGMISASIVTTVTHAHGIWFAQRGNKLALVYGVGADDLDMVKRLPLVNSFKAYDPTGKEVPAKLVPSGPIPVVETDGDPAILAAVMDYGLWSKTPDGKWYNKGKDEITDAVISTHNYKYAVHLRKEVASVPLFPEQVLQLVPVDKIPALLGKPLRLRVFYKGKPVAGARVKTDYVNDPDGEPIKTDKDGYATINVRNQGLNVVVAIYDAPSDTPAKNSKTEHEASLTFVLPHLPE